MRLGILAPVSGVVVDLPQVPDPVFAGQLLGPGAAISPGRSEGPVTALAPIEGRVSKLHAHAFVITGAQGRSVLVHLGLETVSLPPEHFHHHVSQGREVATGQAITTWSPARVAAEGRDPIVPVVAMDADRSALTPLAAGRRVEAGQVLMAWDS